MRELRDMDWLNPGLTPKETRSLYTTYTCSRIIYGAIICRGYKTTAEVDEALQAEFFAALLKVRGPLSNKQANRLGIMYHIQSIQDELLKNAETFKHLLRKMSENDANKKLQHYARKIIEALALWVLKLCAASCRENQKKAENNT